MPRVSSAGLLSSLVLVVSGVSLSQDSLAARTVPDRAHWFNYPQILCRALDAQGFVAGAWAPVDTQSPVYRCSYPPSSRQADIPALIAQAEANQQQPPPDLGFEVSFEVAATTRPRRTASPSPSPLPAPRVKPRPRSTFSFIFEGCFKPSDTRCRRPCRHTWKERNTTWRISRTASSRCSPRSGGPGDRSLTFRCFGCVWGEAVNAPEGLGSPTPSRKLHLG